MKVLVIAPHPDDDILGVGGTIHKRSCRGDDVHVCIVTKGCPPRFEESLVEAGRKEEREAAKYLGAKSVTFIDYKAAMLDSEPIVNLNDTLTGVVLSVQPDDVYIPFYGDVHKDHKIVADAAMVAVRPKVGSTVKRVYAYEVISETGWDFQTPHNLFSPNVFEDITYHLEAKLEALRMFKSQIQEFPNARSTEAVRSLAKYRGATVGLRAAEAFSIIREIKY